MHGRGFALIKVCCLAAAACSPHLTPMHEHRRVPADGLNACAQGLPVDTWTTEQTVTAYFGIGTHLGPACSQNAKCHLVGHVKDINLPGGFQDPVNRWAFVAGLTQGGSEEVLTTRRMQGVCHAWRAAMAHGPRGRGR